MKTAIILFALMISLILPTICQADYTFLFGLGNNSCSQFLEALSQQPYDVSIKVEGVVWPSKSNAYISWMQGYISAFNMFNVQGKDKNIIIDNDGLAAWTRKYCSDNPNNTVIVSTMELISARTGFDWANSLKTK